MPCYYYPMIVHLIELIILPGSFIFITYVKNILHFHVNEWYKISIFNPKGLNSQKGKWICHQFFTVSILLFLLSQSILFPSHYFVELLKTKPFVWFCLVQNVSIVHHLHNVFLTHCLPQLLCCLLHLFQVNQPTQVVIVKIKHL